MKTNHSVSLSAPKITPAQRQELKTCKQNLEEVIRDIEIAGREVADLQKKKRLLQVESESLRQSAAQFARDAEIKLPATLKQIERVDEAIIEAESRGTDDKAVNFQVTDQSQSLVSKLCQASYNELLDQIAALLSPYYASFNDARFVARSAPAVNDLARRLLARGIV